MKNLLLLIVLTYTCNLCFAQARLPFYDNFESGALNPIWWTAHANLNGANGVVDVQNRIGIDQTIGVRMGKTSDQGGFTLNSIDLKLNLSGENDVELAFVIADQFDESQIEDGLFFSDDGGRSFVKVLDFWPHEWCDRLFGQHPPIDVDELAGRHGLRLNSNFVIRFQQNGQHNFSGGGGAEDGFYLDEVRVYDPELVFADLPFSDNFNTGVMKKSWAWNFADETTTVATGSDITNPMSFVGVVDRTGLDRSHAVLMGRICDGTFTTNALDLHLNLLGEQDVEMTFFIADQFDETHVDDGIYFSDNAGETFVKVLDFLPQEWCDVRFGQHPPIDVDELAAAAGLSLSARFVIRFQQMGQSNFSGGGGAEDGFYLDDVSVYDPQLEFARIPFEDDFNNGIMKKSWAWNFADETVTVATGSSITNPMSFVGVVDQTGQDRTAGVLMGRICDGTFTTNALDLHLNLLGEWDVEMTFFVADQFDETHVDDGLYFSDNDGEDFVKVLDFFPEEWCHNVYGQHPPIDIDELAAQAGLKLTDKFVVRFQQTGQSDFVGGGGAEDGFYLDDVKVYNPNLEYATLPFSDNFERGAFKSAWAWNFADQTSSIISEEAITNPMSFVDVVTGFAHEGSTYSALIGKRCDGSFTTNALDLHLNLLGQPQVTLSFWMADVFEQTQIDDGIYFSDNGGSSFVKVFEFDFENQQDWLYHFYQLDISQLAADNGLQLTEKFVVRFQQRGQYDWFGGGGAEDGMFLDDVQVNSLVTSVSDLGTTDSRLQVFPNPAQSSVFLHQADPEGQIRSVVVSDIHGAILYSRNINVFENPYELDVSSLVSGLYILKVQFSNGTISSHKFIKN